MKTAAPPRPASKGANARLAVCLAIVVATAATLPAGDATALSRASVERQTELKRTVWMLDGSSTDPPRAHTSGAVPTHEASTANALIALPWLRLTPPTLIWGDVCAAENSRLGLGRTGAASRLGRGPPNQRNALGKSARISTNCGGSYDSARYYDPRTAAWQSPDPILAGYLREKSAPSAALSRNMNVYAYTWNNPVHIKDPDGRRVRVVDDPPSKRYADIPADKQRELAKDFIGQVTGSKVFIDADGYVTLGEQVKQGAAWDEARGRFEQLIRDKRVIGMTANPGSQNAWSFDIVGSARNPEMGAWARANGLDAFITFRPYGVKNPYSTDSSLWGLLTGRGKKHEFTIGDHLAHEALGHAYDWVLGTLSSRAKSEAETYARDAENLFRRAEGRPESH